jgi:hypothetical protein
VAICVCRSGICDPIPLRKTDLIVYEVSLPSLSTTLALALGLTPAFAPSDVTHNTVHLGLYFPHEGFRFAAYLSLEGNPIELAEVGAILTSRNDRPFILLTPTRSLWTDDLLFTLDDRQHEILALDDLLELRGGEFHRRNPTMPQLERFYSRHVTDSLKSLSPQPLLFSPGTLWTEVAIRIMDDTDKALIHVGTQQWMRDFRSMGMADKRKSEPDGQWKLLLGLAHDDRRICCEKPGDAERLKQPVRRLRKTLQTLIPIPGDPLPYNHDENAWIAAFHIGFQSAGASTR